MSKTQGKLYVVPCDMAAARDFVARIHRHLSPPLAGKFAVAVADQDGAIRGVAIAGRPVSRVLDDGRTLEVTRVATDGCPNACSVLYGAIRRAAWSLGYQRVYTYTLPVEGGASLRAAGFSLSQQKSGGGEWDRPSRPARPAENSEIKTRWIAERSAPGEPRVCLLDRDIRKDLGPTLF